MFPIRNASRSIEVLLLSLLALVAACGGGDDASPASAQPAASVDGRAATAPTQPEAKALSGPRERPTALATSLASTAPATPKVAIVPWSRYTSTAQQDHIARFDLAILLMPPTSTATTVSSAVGALKSRNPGLMVGQMVNAAVVADSNTSLATPTTTQGWWLKTATGARTAWQGNAGGYDANITSFTVPDSSGRRFAQMRAQHDGPRFFAASTGVDFLYANLVWPSAVDADYRRLGSNQSWKDPVVQAAQRAGHAAYWDALRTIRPGLKVVANIAPAWQTSAELSGKYQGVYLNSLIGLTWSVENTSGWSAMMSRYRAAMSAAATPKMVIFDMTGSATDYRQMRYGLASALLDDGYFSFSATDGTQPTPWFDEFSAPLGDAVEAPPTAPRSGTVWSRRYANGMVLVNTSRTASATLNIESGYKRLAASQDPAVNSGREISSLTLAPRDGIVLLKSIINPPADTQPPTPPGALTLSQLTCQSARLAWQAATDIAGVAAYDVYHDGQFMVSVPGNTLSTALTLNPGVTWGLYVNARDAAENVSQASPMLTVKVPFCNVDGLAPTAPTGLRVSLTGTTAYLGWVASSDNVGVAGYDIYRNDQKVGSTSSLVFTDSALAPNTSYRYAVAARDAQGNVSARSTSQTIITGSACSNVVCAVNTVATETDVPWGFAALTDGTVIYARRDVQDVVRLNPATGVKTSLGKVPNVQGDVEGGLMGLAVTPQFPATDDWIYLFHTSPTDNRIVRIRYRNGALDTSTLQVLLSGIGKNRYHNGGRLRFGPDGKLYATTGDAQSGSSSQNVNALTGKVLRLNPDGTVPSDNPFGNAVWSYGHRNAQGIAFDQQGRLWQQEFGNSLLDETNLVQKGGNYGWPQCEGTTSVSGSGCASAGFIAPKATYLTADGSCSGLTVVRDAVYIACHRGRRLYRAEISGTELINWQSLFVGTYGRIRTVEPSVDGGLWITTSNDGDRDAIPNNSNNKIIKVDLGR